ncbi:MAG TPA: hypothetical protein PLX89_10220 [Verrucomicrobiota bacterium]|nr:hypothetical protein [Verrucomicrobiales bacterium]HRI13371.1 hypothetical protein [Verrucomicrobiota bacterium]
MKAFFRGSLAVLLGLLVGSIVNMGLVLLSPHVIPPPPGVDVGDAKSIRASIHLFEPKHFVFPFLAHALGTLCGAAVGYLVALRYRLGISFVIGTLFLAGGIAAASMIPAPAWFIAVDLLLAYLPMAWLGALLGRSLKKEAVHAP